MKQLRHAIQPSNLSSETSLSAVVDFAKKPEELRMIGRHFARAGQGDRKARKEVLGWIDQQRQWVEALKALLKD